MPLKSQFAASQNIRDLPPVALTPVPVYKPPPGHVICSSLHIGVPRERLTFFHRHLLSRHTFLGLPIQQPTPAGASRARILCHDGDLREQPSSSQPNQFESLTVQARRGLELHTVMWREQTCLCRGFVYKDSKHDGVQLRLLFGRLMQQPLLRSCTLGKLSLKSFLK